jgi:predicted AlkP superfamily pyrophosphatase or phosphodiesterase
MLDEKLPAGTARRFVSIAAAVALVLGAGCAPHYIRTPVDTALRPAPPDNAITRHLLLVSIDGLRPDAVAQFDAPILNRLMRSGSYSLTASTILPSKTLPSHTSMLTGKPPESHGVLWNNVLSAREKTVASSTVFGEARARGYRTAAFFSKPKFQPLQQPGSLDYSQAPGGWFGGWSGARTARDVATYLDGARPNLLFVHLADPDRAGHRAGWMSADYGLAVRAADQALGVLLAACDRAFGEGNYTVIVTADHGGHGYDHGSSDLRDVRIPWIAWGRGVSPGPLADEVRTMDTASTAL